MSRPLRAPCSIFGGCGLRKCGSSPTTRPLKGGDQPAGSSDLVFPGSRLVNHHFPTVGQDLWSHMSFQPPFINPEVSLKLLNCPVPVARVLIISSRGYHYPDHLPHLADTALSQPRATILPLPNQGSPVSQGSGGGAQKLSKIVLQEMCVCSVDSQPHPSPHCLGGARELPQNHLFWGY